MELIWWIGAWRIRKDAGRKAGSKSKMMMFMGNGLVAGEAFAEEVEGVANGRMALAMLDFMWYNVGCNRLYVNRLYVCPRVCNGKLVVTQP